MVQGPLRLDQHRGFLYPADKRIPWDRRRLGSLLRGQIRGDLLWSVLARCWVATLTVMGVLLFTLLAWSLRTCERWICCGGACCQRCRRAPPQDLDPAVQHLPVTPAPSSYSTVRLVGPGCSTPVDTEYFQRQVRGRGAGRKPHDLVLRFPVGAARIQPDWSQRSRTGRVLGVTARSLR